jgi:hypothetical protein
MRSRYSILFLCFCLVMQFSAASFSFATVESNANDRMSSHKISTASNHTFSITLNGALAEGSTLGFKFPITGAFTTPLTTSTDIDFADDDIDISVDDGCATTAPIGYSQTVEASTFTQLFTLCAGDGGAIADGSVVTVEIGTQATFGGSGTVQTTNPSTASVYYITVERDSAASASIPVPIISDDDGGVTVSVTTPPVDGGGGGGGGGGSDPDPEVPDPEDPVEPDPDEPDPEVPDPEVPDPEVPDPEDPVEPDPGPDDSVPVVIGPTDPDRSDGPGSEGPLLEPDDSVIPDPEIVVDEPIEVPLPDIPFLSPIINEQIEIVAQEVFETIDFIREQPEAQVAAEVSTPVVVASIVVSAVVLTSSFNLLAFLQYILFAPVLFIARRRRYSFGTVYNAYTKVPVDLATVKLFNREGIIVKTAVTDAKGRYFFTADPGDYRMSVTKKGFAFPSQYVKTSEDGKWLDIYQHGTIRVTDQDAVISANIPFDPVASTDKHALPALKLKRFMRFSQRWVARIGVLVSLFIIFIQPGIVTVLLAVLQIGIYLLTRRLVRPEKRRGWGIVQEKKSASPLGNTVVRLFEPKYNKLIDSTLTDSRGRYAFLVGPNSYYVTFDKDGYERAELRPIDYTNEKDSKLVSVDVSMDPKE